MFVAIILALGLFPRHVAAQSKTGVELLEECQLAANNDMSTDEKAMKATFCTGYLMGVMDTYTFWGALDTASKESSPPPPCIPNGVTLLELTKVVVKYLNDHPNQLHQTYRLLVFKALTEAYPPRSQCGAK